MAQFTDRVAVVTGASRGIGRCTAVELAKRGASVVVNYIDPFENDANGVVKEIEALGSQAIAVKANVTQAAEVDALMKTTIDRFGKIDILVNNAGTTRDNLIMMMKEEDWDLVLNINLKGAWLCSKAAVRFMIRKRYGRIVNISSVSGIAGQGGQTNYSSSKAGLIGLTKALAREVAGRQVTVNAVAPGFVKTDLTANLPKELLDELNKRIPLERWGTVEDIAHAVAFLASDEASYITGHVLSVDGGLVMG
jgi:3-oxoacyl-[acyl-carrier protein] reductase